MNSLKLGRGYHIQNWDRGHGSWRAEITWGLAEAREVEEVTCQAKHTPDSFWSSFSEPNTPLLQCSK